MDDSWQTQDSASTLTPSSTNADVPPAEMDDPSASDIRHPDLSFEDGNIALRTSGGYYFLVHKGVILRHCGFFRNTMACSDERVSNMVEGRPVVHLTEHPDDMSYFLKALYDGISLLKYTAHDFHIVSAVLRLATKYGADHIRASMLEQLSYGWPATLQQWEQRERLATSPTGMYAPRPTFPHPILVIQLARDINAPQLLPSAFYDLSRYMPSQMVAGCTAADRKHYALSNDDMLHTLKGKESAARFLSSFIVTELEGRDSCERCFYRYPGASHEMSKTCRIAFEAITFEILRDLNGLVCNRNSDPLYAMSETIGIQNRSEFPGDNRIAGHRACEACRLVLATAVDAAREAFWMSLPAWFQIQVADWGHL